MSHTLYAFLALFLAMMFSFSQQQRSAVSLETKIRNELQMMSTAVGSHRLEIVSGMPYGTMRTLDGQTQQDWFIAGADTLEFTLQFQAHYATETGQMSHTPTNYTQVIVSVYNNRWAIPLSQHSRIFSQN